MLCLESLPDLLFLPWVQEADQFAEHFPHDPIRVFPCDLHVRAHRGCATRFLISESRELSHDLRERQQHVCS